VQFHASSLEEKLHVWFAEDIVERSCCKNRVNLKISLTNGFNIGSSQKLVRGTQTAARRFFGIRLHISYNTH
jgi:hypothetical protein